VRRLLLRLFSHRTLAALRVDLHFWGVRLGGLLSGRRRRIAAFVASREAPVLLNLGAGPRGLAGSHWVNVDGYPAPGIDFLIDISRRLPFADAGFDGVFCEHVLEHFAKADGARLAREVARILKPGGIFRVVVPDAAFVLRSYFDAPDNLVVMRGDGEAGETPMDAVNSYFRQRYEHQFMYDWPTLRRLLLDAGFADAAPCAFRTTTSDLPLAIDAETYLRESLYVEARTASGRDTTVGLAASETARASPVAA
jgi:predicted SAM-dependent methyltransferase